MTDRAIELLEEQQRNVKERSAPWMVAEQLKDICRREPHSAEILAQDPVYITSSGTRYHKSWCPYLENSKIPLSRDEAEEDGYSPRSRCNP